MPTAVSRVSSSSLCSSTRCYPVIFVLLFSFSWASILLSLKKLKLDARVRRLEAFWAHDADACPAIVEYQASNKSIRTASYDAASSITRHHSSGSIVHRIELSTQQPHPSTSLIDPSSVMDSTRGPYLSSGVVHQAIPFIKLFPTAYESQSKIPLGNSISVISSTAVYIAVRLVYGSKSNEPRDEHRLLQLDWDNWVCENGGEDINQVSKTKNLQDISHDFVDPNARPVSSSNSLFG